MELKDKKLKKGGEPERVEPLEQRQTLLVDPHEQSVGPAAAANPDLCDGVLLFRVLHLHVDLRPREEHLVALQLEGLR